MTSILIDCTRPKITQEEYRRKLIVFLPFWKYSCPILSNHIACSGLKFLSSFFSSGFGAIKLTEANSWERLISLTFLYLNVLSGGSCCRRLVTVNPLSNVTGWTWHKHLPALHAFMGTDIFLESRIQDKSFSQSRSSYTNVRNDMDHLTDLFLKLIIQFWGWISVGITLISTLKPQPKP